MDIGTADLHMHTNRSDGQLSPSALLDYIQENTDLDVIAITDHDTLEPSFWAYERRHRYTFDIVPGMEITSADGHVLAWWIQEPVPSGLSLGTTVSLIHRQGGIACLAHPFELVAVPFSASLYWNNPEIIGSVGLDALEVYNAGSVTAGANSKALKTATDYGLTQIGNSDAHVPQAVGSGRTQFLGKSGWQLKNAIVSRKTRVIRNGYSLLSYAETAVSLPSRTIRYARRKR